VTLLDHGVVAASC